LTSWSTEPFQFFYFSLAITPPTAGISSGRREFGKQRFGQPYKWNEFARVLFGAPTLQLSIFFAMELRLTGRLNDLVDTMNAGFLRSERVKRWGEDRNLFSD
jgi:hypothetical protein